MKINRKDLQWFMKNIRYHSDGKELTDEELVDKLAGYMETNPRCVDMDGVSNPGRRTASFRWLQAQSSTQRTQLMLEGSYRR